MRFKVRENSGQLPARAKWDSSPLMGSRRSLIIGVAVAGVLALLGAGYWAIYASQPQSEERLVEAPKEPPQLHCVLIQFTGEPRLSFLFDISQVGNELRFDQLYLVEISGSDKTVKQPPFPEWQFDASAEPARLESEISVFDNSAAGSHTGENPLSPKSEPVRTVPAVTTSPSGLRRAIDARSLLLRDGAIRALDESQISRSPRNPAEAAASALGHWPKLRGVVRNTPPDLKERGYSRDRAETATRKEERLPGRRSDFIGPQRQRGDQEAGQKQDQDSVHDQRLRNRKLRSYRALPDALYGHVGNAANKRTIKVTRIIAMIRTPH